MADGVRDRQTSTPGSGAMQAVPEGVTFRRVNTLVDERGSLCEMFDERWDWHPDPLVYSYFCTIRPGVVKGWALHREHENPDKYRLPLDTDLIPHSFGDAEGW